MSLLKKKKKKKKKLTGVGLNPVPLNEHNQMSNQIRSAHSYRHLHAGVEVLLCADEQWHVYTSQSTCPVESTRATPPLSGLTTPINTTGNLLRPPPASHEPLHSSLRPHPHVSTSAWNEERVSSAAMLRMPHSMGSCWCCGQVTACRLCRRHSTDAHRPGSVRMVGCSSGKMCSLRCVVSMTRQASSWCTTVKSIQ